MAPVVIPALAPMLDKSLQEDKTLCPVRALRYYLDRTKDLRKGKDFDHPCFWAAMIPNGARGIVVVSSDPIRLPLLGGLEL